MFKVNAYSYEIVHIFIFMHIFIFIYSYENSVNFEKFNIKNGKIFYSQRRLLLIRLKDKNIKRIIIIIINFSSKYINAKLVVLLQ